MASTLWTKLAALSIGTVIASMAACIATVGRVPWSRPQFKVDPVQARAEAHKEQVVASRNEGSPEEWWGSYGHSNGFEGCRLELGPGGFYYEAFCCLGTPELGYGKIASVDGARVRLEFVEHLVDEELQPPRRSTRKRDRFRMSADLYVVPWGEECLIVPAEQMVEFCSLAKATRWDAMTYADYPHKLEPHEGMPHMPDLIGLPDVPAEFRQYMPE